MIIKDNIFIITGAASGLGKQTLYEIVNNGGKVIIFDINEKCSEELVCQYKNNEVFYPCKVDVKNEQDVINGINISKKKYKEINGLILCSGIVSDKNNDKYIKFKNIITNNLFGTYNVIDKFVEMFKENIHENRSGIIILVSSIVGLDGPINREFLPYAISKSAISNLTYPLAKDFSIYKIRVMCIAPGVFMTPLYNKYKEESIKDIIFQYPNRLGDPKEFSKLVKDIIENNMLNGETIRLDAAMRVKNY
jgi:3-hydroxyacyl-CoA dehydrogenase/3-hydroxy-2-methylbutyryl-CoA dehydrogenase